ncbi:hypothetical protein [Aeromicrobium sp. UC242_57]|uniref:hypothetical protein n=1 Tax=Aeromicrobium sp. UC242_57 TaxID=3374624 RepID=UPI0037BC18BA
MQRTESAIRGARWYLESGSPIPAELAPIAAREANRRGLYHRATAYSSTQNTAATPLETQHQRSHALIQIGDTDGLAELLRTIDPAAVPSHELMAFTRWAIRMIPAEDRPAFRERAIGPEARPVAEQNQRAAAVDLAELLLLALNESGDQHVRRVRALLFSGSLSPVDSAMAHTVLACLLRHAARTSEAVHAAAISLEMLQSPDILASAPELDPARETLFMSLLGEHDLDGAERVLGQYQAEGARYGRPGRLGPAMSGALEFHRGRPQHGIVSLHLLLEEQPDRDVLHTRGWVQALAAQALVGLGRADEAEQLLASSELDALPGMRQFDLERRLTQAYVHDSLADPDRALEILTDVADEAHAHGLTLVELDARGMIVLIDGPSRAPQLVGAVDDLVAPSGMPAMWKKFAPLAASYDFAGLIELIDELVAEGQTNSASRFAQFTLDSGRRATDLTAAERERLDLLAHPPT